MSDERPAPLLDVSHLEKTFTIGRGGLRRKSTTLRAVDDVSFTIPTGETFGLVGESGCGKSTIARCVLRLTEATAGSVTFDGIDVGALPSAELRTLRRRMQVVHQDPTGSLDPRMTIGALLQEPLVIHGVDDGEARRARAVRSLALVGLEPDALTRRPHEFSGGQRQRIGIARALTLDPDLVVLDEPVSALDVSIQAQVLNLLSEVQERLGLTYLFIVHDLAVAEHFCDRLAVLYLGRIMEMGTREELFRAPKHPYTVALLSAAPIPDPEVSRARRPILLSGDAATATRPTTGCPFRARCPVGRDRDVCAQDTPPLVAQPSGQLVACHFPGEASG